MYLIYTNELEIFNDGRPEFLDRSAHTKGPYRMTRVRGYPALGNDPYIKTFSDGHRNNIISSLNWWVNRVAFTTLSPDMGDGRSRQGRRGDVRSGVAREVVQQSKGHSILSRSGDSGNIKDSSQTG